MVALHLQAEESNLIFWTMSWEQEWVTTSPKDKVSYKKRKAAEVWDENHFTNVIKWIREKKGEHS